ncbi:MAG: hypothetical protein UW66_C0005G0012 [Candidatus Moranbacteria bacterium GW2011_GWF1_44_4]|nr:MAG: hypothetical protein UW66_C0005G0012 [Candidatus Moranbacteria bacterium GW2011_GWF1_44_4]
MGDFFEEIKKRRQRRRSLGWIVEKNEIMDCYYEFTPEKIRNIEMGKMNKVKLKFFQQFWKLELFPETVPRNIRHDLDEIRASRPVFMPIFLAQKNIVLIVPVNPLEIFDEFLGISPKAFPD